MAIEMIVPAEFWQAFRDRVTHTWFRSDNPVLTKHNPVREIPGIVGARFESEFESDFKLLVSLMPDGTRYYKA